MAKSYDIIDIVFLLRLPAQAFNSGANESNFLEGEDEFEGNLRHVSK